MIVFNVNGVYEGIVRWLISVYYGDIDHFIPGKLAYSNNLKWVEKKYLT
jgi:hypothetical protein